jgi:hypothetical protein
MKDTDSAFPVMDTVMRDGGKALESIAPGMTLPQYAAIHLKVPRSGDAEIDAMIRESRRAEFAGLVIGFIALGASKEVKLEDVPRTSVETAYAIAAAMLAELDKEEC